MATMNSSVANRRPEYTGSSAQADPFQSNDLACAFDLLVVFIAASCVARIFQSRNYILHGLLNILLTICHYGGLSPTWEKLLSSYMIWGSVGAVLLRMIMIRALNGTKDPGSIHHIPTQHEVKLFENVKDTIESRDSSDGDSKQKTESENHFLKSMIFPSRTTHRRIFPTPHAFSYSYLLVGVPVSAVSTQETQFTGIMLSSHPREPHRSPDNTGIEDNREAWLSVHASDYLQRGTGFSDMTLREKLELYLKAEGVDPVAYPHAYLITAPRFLGFSFNPVSFWYLYNKREKLAAMILEVNNTFDERRMYLLRNTPTQPSSDHDAESRATISGNATGPRQKNTQKRFVQHWAKDFHVSPFNDRDGSYSVTVEDIAKTNLLDNTIVLRSDDERPKIVARIYSTQEGIDLTAMTVWSKATFLLNWFWVGFMTNPRILKEARVLWLKKLKVFYRPEPLRSNIGRNETAEETVIEKAFRRGLTEMAHRAGISVEYCPAAGEERQRRINAHENLSISVTGGMPKVKLQVLTPEFYSEIARNSGQLLAMFERTCFQSTHTSEDTRTPLLVWTDSEALLQQLISKTNGDEETCIQNDDLALHDTKLSRLEYSVALLREREKSILTIMFCVMVRMAGFQFSCLEARSSELDQLVKNTVGAAVYFDYLWSALQIVLMDRVALGFRGLFRLEVRIVRLVIVAVLAQLVWQGWQVTLTQRQAVINILLRYIGIET